MRQALSVISTALLIPVVLLALLSAGARLCGLYPYVVLSGSMEPAIRTGAAVYIGNVSPASVEVGDIITFSIDGNASVTHRVIEIIGSGDSLCFRTKGDANAAADSALVSPAQLMGRAVFSIPGLGRLLVYVHTPSGRWMAIVFGVVLIALAALPETPFLRRRPENMPPTRRDQS